MKRDTAEIIQADKLNLLHAVVRGVFDLDDSLRQVCLALLALNERQSGDTPDGVLIRPVNLHAGHFEDYLAPDTPITSLLRRLQLENPQVTIPVTKGTRHFQTEAPLFEIVSSLELTGHSPRINWWVRAGQWCEWGLTPFDRHLLCRFAMTVIAEQDPKYHRLLALLLLSVALRVDDAFQSEDGAPVAPVHTVEISVKAIRDDLLGLEKMLKFLPKKTDLRKQSGIAIDDFINNGLFHYTDISHESVRVLPLWPASEGQIETGEK